MKALETRIPPVPVALLLGGVMWLVDRYVRVAGFHLPAAGLVTTAAWVVGLLFVLPGVIAFARARTTVNPRRPMEASALVTVGIYRFSRNPMYVGLLFLLLSWALHLANAIAFLGLPAFVLYMDRYQIVPEEAALERRFGEEYRRYQASVRRWL